MSLKVACLIVCALTVVLSLSACVHPMIEAAGQGNTKGVLAHLNHGVDVNLRSPDVGNVTALHWAARGGHVETMQTLLEKGADVNAAARDGRTPLHEAAASGHEAAVRLLLDRGAQVDATTTQDTNLSVGGGFRSLHSGSTPLHEAAQIGHVGVVRVLIEQGADVNKRNSYQSTPLQPAAALGHMEVVRYLLDHGADVHAKSKTGWTALHAAARRGQTDVVSLLLERGASPQEATPDGWTAVRLARFRGGETTARVIEQWQAGTAPVSAPTSTLDRPSIAVPDRPGSSPSPSEPPPPPIY